MFDFFFHPTAGAGRHKRTRKHAANRKLKTMKCNPVSGKIGAHDSCYTPQILEKIRVEYNKSHHSDPITETEPTKLWLELRDRLTHCSAEDCWLSEIKDATTRKQIDRYIFAPDKPYEWKANPNEWLSNYDILNVLEQYEHNYKHFEFIGPTPIDFDTKVGSNRQCVLDELCKFSLSKHIRNGKTMFGVVFNLDKHDESGSHWVSMFINVSKRFLFYFDSAGGNMPHEVRTLITRIQKQAKDQGFQFKEYANGRHTHQRGNTECGVYSLFFIITMLTGRTKPNGRKMSHARVFDLFLNKHIPDKTIATYRNEYFNG